MCKNTTSVPLCHAKCSGRLASHHNCATNCKERSCADAIEQCHTTLAGRGEMAPWILEGDIKSCFDMISHPWLLNHIPMETRILEQWLQAGYMEKSVLYPTEDGAPQGGILTPPTKLPTFFFGVRIARVRIDPKHDVDLIPS